MDCFDLFVKKRQIKKITYETYQAIQFFICLSIQLISNQYLIARDASSQCHRPRRIRKKMHSPWSAKNSITTRHPNTLDASLAQRITQKTSAIDCIITSFLSITYRLTPKRFHNPIMTQKKTTHFLKI